MYFRLDNFKLNALTMPYAAEVVDRMLIPPLAAALGIPAGALAGEYKILAKSVDARRGAPELVYNLGLEVADEFASALRQRAAELTAAEFEQLELAPLPEIADCGRFLRHPVIAGGGPAGLLAALYLARANCAPLVLDRGFDVDARAADCETFFRTRVLNPESNLLFGAGGAGTFSDGKLYTRVHDPRADFVLRALIEAGAPADTAYLKRPHLGTDLLRGIVRNLRTLVERAGGTFRFGAAVAGVRIEHGVCRGVRLVSGEIIDAPAVILAHGLGGRDLTRNLLAQVRWELKGFQIGCRVEHLQSWVDQRQYRVAPRPSCLGAAEYNMVCKSRAEMPGGGVTTFCMCPGGEIVPATAWPGRLSSNGMSLRARDGRFANAAVITTLNGSDFGTPERAYEFLEALEQKCFEAGGGEYGFPAQSIESFIRRRTAPAVGGTSARLGVCAAPLHELLPRAVALKFAEAFGYFDRLMPGFRAGNAVGIESCVSSPVRFVRDAETLQSSVRNLYLAGEGAGYAGGIVSAAIDGLRTAEKLADESRKG